ncbi:MAG: PSD1 and planctomycete cytochrome C domain-containing protein [Planctomycetota bacterium]
MNRLSYQALATVLICLGNQSLRAENPISYNRDIRPILADKCFACHGFDEKKREAGLRLDTAEGATFKRDGKSAISPGDLAASLLWERVHATDPDVKMPPPDSHKELTAAEIELLGRWIKEGGQYQKHWSFEPPMVADVPPQTAGGKNSIDAFIGKSLEANRWKLSDQASKSTLIRRVAFTLTGLPPTVEEMEAYLSDESADAYEKMVDRYLQSNRYGEEMARHWLDIARYADTHGLHLDNERQMWAYRDWVVKSFNRNLPFDQFTIEQLAGDLLENPTIDQLIATGFNRCNVTTSEGGSIDAEYYYRYAVDRTSTMASTWLALTAGCAVCHDHKFDPIPTKEFYSMYAFFNASADPAMDGNALLTNPVLKLETDEEKAKLAQYDKRIGELQSKLNQAVAKIVYNDPALSDPKPQASSSEILWMEDDYPAGGNVAGSPGHPTMFVSVDQGEKVLSGKRALKRSDAGLSQDVWGISTVPVSVPVQATLFAHVFIDPANPPKSVMLQYHRNGWLHRAVWGEYDAIPWGTANTPERVHMGPLPKSGEWVRLEVSAEKVGLNAGDNLTGFATTQFGGTVYWDKIGVSGVSDPANDPLRSFVAWWKAAKGKDTAGLPGDLNNIAKAGPDPAPDVASVARLKEHYLARICSDTKPVVADVVSELDQTRSQRDNFYNAIPSTFIYKDNPTPRESFVMLRGQYNQPGEKVQPDVLSILPAIQKPQSGQLTRLDLAKWLVTPRHPLTSRVAVNRFWQQVFGVGLVKTSGDFGTQGETPSHPELLDWLAIQFEDSNWDIKALMRLMLTSATFKQNSKIPADVLEKDPENRMLARAPRLRLDAEQIRDNALFVGGVIDLTLGGKGVKPYQPPNIWEPVGFVGSNTRAYQQDKGSALYRRSLYTFYKRTAPPPFMVNFDAPNREQTCTRRERSNTPLQALQLLNDVQHVEAARGLGQRILSSGQSSVPERIELMFKTVLSRKPSSRELEVLDKQVNQHLQRYRANPADAQQLIQIGESKPSENFDPAELATYTLLASTILNMDETLTRN